MERETFKKEFLESKAGGVYSLFGPAGSGKSQIIIDIVQELQKSKTDFVVLTPTHAAKNRLKADGISAGTIHSFLGIGMVTNLLANSAVDAEEESSFNNTFEEIVRVVIVDEFSMASKKLLVQLKKRSIKLLLVGDTAQLPPVKALGLTRLDVESKSVVSYELTKIYRTSNETIKERSAKCRDTGAVDVDGTVDELTTAFLEDPSEDKLYCAYLNAEVTRVTELLHSEPKEGMEVIGHTGYKFWSSKHGTHAEELFNGDLVEVDKILDQKPYCDGATQAFELYDFPNLENDPKYFKCTMVGVSLPFVQCYLGNKKKFQETHLDPVFRVLRRLAAKMAVKYSLKDSGDVWAEYKSGSRITAKEKRDLSIAYRRYKQMDNVFVCTDARVSTVHKAQGRGFDNVYVNLTKMDAKQKYVAVTRAKNKLTTGVK